MFKGLTTRSIGTIEGLLAGIILRGSAFGPIARGGLVEMGGLDGSVTAVVFCRPISRSLGEMLEKR